MKRVSILLPIVAAFLFIFAGHTGASSPLMVNNHAVAGVPLASSVISVSGAISGLGIAGHYILSRRQK